jgi:predicted phage tail protein
MKKLTMLFLALFVMVGLSGCGNLSPRFDPKLDQKLNNQNGKIDSIETIQNGFKNDLFNLKQQAEIQNSKLDHVQSGMANLQSTNQNSGIQILSGTGGLLIAGVITIVAGFVAMGYRRQAKESEKAANLIAQQVAMRGDEQLEENVFKAAMYTEVEEKVLALIKKHQVNFQ